VLDEPTDTLYILSALRQEANEEPISGRRHGILPSKTVDEANSGVDDPLQWGECGVWQPGHRPAAHCRSQAV